MRETANIQKILPEAHASQAKHEEPREPFYETKLKSSNHETIRDHFQLFLPFYKKIIYSRPDQQQLCKICTQMRLKIQERAS